MRVSECAFRAYYPVSILCVVTCTHANKQPVNIMQMDLIWQTRYS